MKELTLTLLLVLFLSALSPLSAGIVTYTDRSAFEAALTGYLIDGWESYGTVGTPSSGAVYGLNFSDFLVTTVPNALKILDAPDGYGSYNTTPTGSHYLYLDTDIGLQGSITTFGMHSPTMGFGFDYTGVTAGTTFTVTILGTPFPSP